MVKDTVEQIVEDVKLRKRDLSQNVQFSEIGQSYPSEGIIYRKLVSRNAEVIWSIKDNESGKKCVCNYAIFFYQDMH